MQAAKQFSRIGAGFLCLVGNMFNLGSASSVPSAISQAKARVQSATLYACDTNDVNCTPATSFSLSSLGDLYVFVRWSSVPFGTHTQQINLVQPNDVLCCSYSKSFLASHAPKRSLLIETDVPIAGTQIQLRDLTGLWRVDLYLDGQFVTSLPVQFDP